MITAIKEGSFTFIEGRGPVEPFKGKYAVKDPRFFDIIRADWERMELYERSYGTFPHNRVHSTMRVYLENNRLESQKPICRPGITPVVKWMDHCYDCFAPTVGSYVLPTALMKHTGDLYSCAAFDVPEKLRFGNLFSESAWDVLDRVNRSAYVVKIRAGGGLKAMHDVVPQSVSQSLPYGEVTT